MPTYNLYMAGSHPANAVSMQPGAVDTAAFPAGFTAGLRKRAYQVARVVDFRALSPIGGADVRVDQMDRDFLDANPLAVNDVLRLIYLPKYSRVEFAHAFIMVADAALSITFGLEVGGVFTATAGLGTLGVAVGATSSALLNTQVTTNDTYFCAKIIALPTTNTMKNMRFGAQVEVVDWAVGFDSGLQILANES